MSFLDVLFSDPAERLAPELLAPAGSPEALLAAVRSGADAVYLALDDFNARRGAKNFSDEAFQAAVHDCHLRGVRVYLTLNILLTDRELPRAVEMATFASSCGVDAILVQDIGLAQLLRQSLPDTALHASTQMTIHNLPGLRFCAEQGFTRAVLARELGREDLRTLCKNAPIEPEVFAHGALCMCYSGQCYFSALVGERSGNRGLCAQPCRMAFRREGEDTPSYPLSLKDLSLADHLDELSDMYMPCIKLEGRMKRPEYVAIVTKIYKTLLEERRRPTPDEENALQQAFSREGFTQGYYLHQKDASMFGRRPEGETMPEALLTAARTAYTAKEAPTIPLTMQITILAGEAARLQLSDPEGHAVCSLGLIPEAARSRALDEESVIAQLSKTGGTVFFVDQVHATIGEGLSLPLSALNALRRDALAQMEAARTALPTRRVLPPSFPTRVRGANAAPAQHIALTRYAQLSEALLQASPAFLSLPLTEWAAHREDLQALFAPYPNVCPVVQVPRVVTDAELPELCRLLVLCHEAGVKDALVGTWGLLEPCRQLGYRLHGDFGLGITNSASMQALQGLDFVSVTVSFELNFAQIRDLSKPLPTEALVYGRFPLMLTEHCLLKPHGKTCVSCTEGACPQEGQALIDRRQESFPILQAFGGRSELYNAKTLYLADKRADFNHIGLSTVRLLFTTESADDCLQILRAYGNEAVSLAPQDVTRGLYYRRVE